MANEITTDNINTKAQEVASIGDGDYVYIFKTGAQGFSRIAASHFAQGGSSGGGNVTVEYDSLSKTTSITIGGASVTPDPTPDPGTTPTPSVLVQNIAGGKSVTVSTSSGVTVYYTTDGTTPTESSQVYSNALNFTSVGSYAFKAVAKASGKEISSVATKTFTVTQLGTPSITSSDANEQTIITAAKSGATVYISTDGNNWSHGNSSASVTINHGSMPQVVTVYAYATQNGYVDSAQSNKPVTVPASGGSTSSNIFSGTSSSEIPAITINGTTYTDEQNGSAPYIVNTQVDGGYEWSIDFGNTAFADAIAFGGTGTQSIFNDGTTDYKARVTGITHLPSSWSAIGTYAFWCPNCAVLNLGDAIQTVGENSCVAVKANPLTVPDTVATIGRQAFRSSTSKSIYLGASNIGNAALDSNVSVTDITFGSGVKKIGTYLFMQRALTHLTTATFLGATPPTFDDQNLFGTSQADGFKIIVPKGSLNAYKTALTDLVDVIEEAQ